MMKSNGWHLIGFGIIAKAATAFLCMYATCWSAAASECPQAKEISQSAGKMIVAGFFGSTVSDTGFQQILADLDSGTIGGVLILGRNIGSRQGLEQMMTAIAKCKCSQTPFIAIDEEGGAIERLGTSLGEKAAPSASDVAQGSLATAHDVYSNMADKLSALHFNVNLGPVVDLNRNPHNPVIGKLGRSYGTSVDTVVTFATAFIEEHRKRNILTVLKHFPGHGSSTTDSHDGIADVTSTWSPEELEPFKRLIDRGLADVIMVGHLTNSSKWGGVATQSRSNAISQILRRDLGFDGVIMTDDLAMKAVSDGAGSTIGAASDAIKAGADMLLVGRLGDDDQTADVGAQVNRSITSKVCTGEIDIDALRRSENRILKLRRHWTLPPLK
jgi:beta-N-acetylhexosaminidase